MTEIKEMRVGSGKERDLDGSKKKILRYASRCGKSLTELLKENSTVHIISMGADASNNVLKAIHYAQDNLRNENKDLLVDEVRIEERKIERNNGKVMPAKLIVTVVKLV